MSHKEWTLNVMSFNRGTSPSEWIKVAKPFVLMIQAPSNTAESQSNTRSKNNPQQTTLTGLTRNNKGSDF
jgi:hypothetical protein